MYKTYTYLVHTYGVHSAGNLGNSGPPTPVTISQHPGNTLAVAVHTHTHFKSTRRQGQARPFFSLYYELLDTAFLCRILFLLCLLCLVTASSLLLANFPPPCCCPLSFSSIRSFGSWSHAPPSPRPLAFAQLLHLFLLPVSSFSPSPSSLFRVTLFRGRSSRMAR